jgi:hypothetical protein
MMAVLPFATHHIQQLAQGFVDLPFIQFAE